MAVLIGSGAGQGLPKPALNPIDPFTLGHLSGQSSDAVWLRHLRTKKLQDKLPVLPVVGNLNEGMPPLLFVSRPLTCDGSFELPLLVASTVFFSG